MLTVGDALTKTLAKSQKVTFWRQKNSFKCFFLLTAGDNLSYYGFIFLSKNQNYNHEILVLDLKLKS